MNWLQNLGLYLLQTILASIGILLEVCVAFIAGCAVTSWIESNLAKLVWILPLVWMLIFMAYRSHSAAQASVVPHIWMQFVSSKHTPAYVGYP
jgi:hypothetical protein